MNNLKKFMERVSGGNDLLAKSITTVDSGWDTFKGLGGKYNRMAKWCGEPKIPSIFTK
ncbi:hypothetical protein [Xanthovirga aplysinae]|uniref:hypothetical protein n=1 Tax=Xanthovirga aplysinae TaxID=2529853 RepID=UPI0012BB74EE|nr:hypothetical protein [Xanthovirga aplysinae]